MKIPTKIIRTVLFSISMFSLSVGCGEKQPQQPGEEKEDVKPPDQIISLEQARVLYENYSTRRAPLIEKYESGEQDEVKFRPARYTAYDYATIKQYLEYVEQEAAAAGVSVSSLRFYFGNYSEEANFEDGKEVRYPRQNSVFVLPTTRKGGQDVGFFTVDSREEGRRELRLLGDALQSDTTNSTGSTGMARKSYAGFAPVLPVWQGGVHSLILNEGNSSPPPN